MTASLTEFYYGAISAVTPGATIVPRASARAEAQATLDAGRQSGTFCRSMSISAASSIKDATAIAAVRSGYVFVRK
jgi:hypothetical protein